MTEETEPDRLMRSGDTRLRSLLESARRDAPSARALRRAPVAISALLAAGTAEAAGAALGGTAAAAAPKAATLAITTAGKWLAIGVVTGSLFSAGALELQPAKPPGSTSTRPKITQAAPKSRNTSAPSERKAEPVEPIAAIAASATVVNAEVRTAPTPSSSIRAAARADLAREIAVLDAATAALSAGAPDRALRLLDSAPELRTLAPEATVLRVRALLRSGRRDAARQVVEAFAISAPKAPQLAVLRELITSEKIP
ncbi:MAG: hypothetical protein ACOY0T_05535 [Myxococcota bacterium]